MQRQLFETERPVKSPVSSLDQFDSAYFALFKNTTDAILLVCGARLHANAAACSLLGFDAAEFAGFALADLFDLDAPPVAAFFERLAATRQASGDFPVGRKERSAMLANVDGSAFESPAGDIWQTLMLRRAGASSSLQSQRRHGDVGLRAVIETLPDMFWLKDPAGVYLMCNQEFQKFLAASEADIVGKTDYDLTNQAKADEWRLHDAAALLAGKPTVVEEWVTYRTDGRRARMLITKAPLLSADGQQLGVLGIGRDITAAKNHETLLKANNLTLAQIARGAPLPDILNHIVRNIEEQNPEMLCTIMLLDSSGQHMRIGAAPNLPASVCAAIDGKKIGPSVGSCGTSAYLGKPVFVEDIATDPLWAAYRKVALDNDLRACWSAPIRSVAGLLLGTFAIYYRQPRRAGEQDIRLIDMATSIAAIAIESSAAAEQRRHVAEELRDHQTRLALALEGSGTGVWDRDLRTRQVKYSNGWKALFGFGEVDVQGADNIGRLHPGDLPNVKAQFQAHLRGETELYAAEHRVLCKDGSYKWVISRGKIVDRDATGTPVRMIGTTTDINDMKLLEKTILENEEKYRTLAENSPDAIIRYDLDLHRIYVNKAFESVTGVSTSRLIGQTIASMTILSLPSRDAMIESLRRVIQTGVEDELEIQFERTGEWRTFHTRAIPEFDDAGKVKGVITFSRDITERKRLEAELQQLATTDFLTGLPNRRFFVTRLEEELARIQRLGVPRTTVLLIDIDHFKIVNDSHGHATGDLVLKNFADIARAALRKIDTVGRVGGEEFAIILPGADVADAMVFAERFRKKVEDSSVMRDGVAITVTISIGVSAISPNDASADAILSRTDHALYRSKAGGRNRVEIE